jgi:hypothetical protein
VSRAISRNAGFIRNNGFLHSLLEFDCPVGEGTDLGRRAIAGTALDVDALCAQAEMLVDDVLDHVTAHLDASAANVGLADTQTPMSQASFP